MSSSSSRLLVRRAAAQAKRGSRARFGWPVASASTANSASDQHDSASHSPSLHRYAPCGIASGSSLPQRWASRPVAKKSCQRRTHEGQAAFVLRQVDASALPGPPAADHRRERGRGAERRCDIVDVRPVEQHRRAVRGTGHSAHAGERGQLRAEAGLIGARAGLAHVAGRQHHQPRVDALPARGIRGRDAP